jgi:hypothetical protein
MRILLWLVTVLSGLLAARTFLDTPDAQPRLIFHGVRIVSEQSVAALHELPLPLAPTMKIAELVAEKPPPPLPRVMLVPEAADKPPTPVAHITTVQDLPRPAPSFLAVLITQVDAQAEDEPPRIDPDRANPRADGGFPTASGSRVLADHRAISDQVPPLMAPLTQASGETADQPPQPVGLQIPDQRADPDPPPLTQITQGSTQAADERHPPITQVAAQAAQEAPLLVSPIGTVFEQSVASAHALSTSIAHTVVVRIGQVSEQSFSPIHEPLFPIAEGAGQSVATLPQPSARIEQIALEQPVEISNQSATARQEPPSLATHTGGVPDQTLRDIPPLIIPVAEIAEPGVPTTLAVAATECEQIWDLMTHMTLEEWAEACRRVDGERGGR